MSLKNIEVLKTVILNLKLTEFLGLIDDKLKDLKLVCTSGVRTKERQLELILARAKKNGVEFPEMKKIESAPFDRVAFFKNDLLVYPWQRAYFAVLKSGFIIAPPVEIDVLVGQNFNIKTKDKKYPSRHILGRALDFDGRTNLQKKVDFFSQFVGDKLEKVIVERAQNCVHIELKNV